MRKTTTVIAAAIATLGLAACGGTGAVDAAQVEEKAKEALGSQMPADVEIDCPEDLKAEEGATVKCTWTMPDGTSLGMTATATSVDGSNVQMNFKNYDAVTPAE